MSRLFLIAQTVPFGLSTSAEREVRRVPLARRERWAVFFFLASALLGVAYLFVVNSLATTGFALKSKTAHVTALEESYKTLGAEREELRSWDTIAARLPELDLIEAKKVEYVTVQNPVAMHY